LADQPGKPQPMLLLRVSVTPSAHARLPTRSGKLAPCGPINMIGGTDLATALLEPMN